VRAPPPYLTLPRRPEPAGGRGRPRLHLRGAAALLCCRAAAASGTAVPFPAPYALRPTPYALRPTPYALRPTPYALRPAPSDTTLTPATPTPPLQFFDRECDALLSGWEDSANLNRDILLDLVAEIVSCYHYSRHFTGTGALAKYKAFVQGQVARKYAPGEPFVYRYFAHADLPSDHEAVSLYHMLMTLSH
jgi:hypothetical protein